MAAKTTAYLEALLDLIFRNTALANIGDTSGLQPSATPGNLYVSLHTASPTTSGDQSTNECTYTGYSRLAVPRSSPDWTRSGVDISPGSNLTFGSCTAGSESATYMGIGTDATGAGHLLYFGPITPTIAISTGITPVLTTGTTITEN